MDNTVRRSKEKINKVFEEIKNKEITISEKKERLSDRSIESYKNAVQSYANYLYEKHAIKDIGRSKPKFLYMYIDEQIRKYHDGENVSAYSTKRMIHALHIFQESTSKTNVFKRKIKIGDKRIALKKMNDHNFLRKSESTTNMKANHNEYKKVDNQIKKNRTKQKNQIREIHAAQRFLGLRITEAFTIKKQDVEISHSGVMIVRIKGKGGLIRKVKTEEPLIIEIIRDKIHSKKPGANIFSIQDKYGNDKSLKSSTKQVKEVVKNAAERAHVNETNKTYTTHSARKAFAQERMNYYKTLSYKELEIEVEKACKLDPRLKKKYDTTLKNIRSKIKKENRMKRTLTKKEIVKWLVSTELGHGRLDVVRYYASY